MRWLLFLSRLAFICNIFFVLAILIQMTNWLSHETLIGTIAIMGYLMVALLNPVVNISYLVLFVLGKKIRAVIPLWLIYANTGFLIMQFFYILYLNDTLHT
jgi:hypothetical protein